MEMEPGRLELTFHVTGLETPFAADPDWPEAEFQQHPDARSATLRLWLEGVPPQEIEAACQQLTDRAAGFELAMRYRGNGKLACRLVSAVFRAATDVKAHSCKVLAARVTGESPLEVVGLTATVELEVAPRQPPAALPSIPLHCKHWVETLLLARAAGDPAQALRIEFLLLEEFKADVDRVLYDQLKAARDFVSHPVVDRPQPMDFIRAEFPQALLPGGQEARYDTSQVVHRNFISRWEAKARDEVTRLIEQHCPVS